MRFHVVSLPHTVTSKEFLSCAYTQKVFNFCRMMKSLGHEVFHYGGEGSTPDCTEHVDIITALEQQEYFGKTDTAKDFYPIVWDENLPYWKTCNANAIEEIGKRIQPKDFICVIAGLCQKPIADAFPGEITVEFGIGYRGTFSKYRVFESYAFMHYMYGRDGVEDGRYYDTVIPNYFDEKDFYLAEKKEDYFLFIGRLVGRKGINIAAQVCEKLGVKLKVAGQGIVHAEPGRIISSEVDLKGNVEYVGTVGVKERARLMAHAKGVFVETQYIGPFEGVHVEAMLSGTPVLTTDWGVFTETVIPGINGFRTRSLGEAIWAAKECEKLDSKRMRDFAIARFSLDVVKYRYQDYFTQLFNLWEKGWETEEFDPADKLIHGNFS